MKTINEDNKNIIVNCISSENLILEYKNNIYPFKNKNKLKKLKLLGKACFFIFKKNIKNKIIII